MRHMRSQRGIVHLILIIIIAAAAIGGYWAWKNYGAEIARPKAAGAPRVHVVAPNNSNEILSVSYTLRWALDQPITIVPPMVYRWKGSVENKDGQTTQIFDNPLGVGTASEFTYNWTLPSVSTLPNGAYKFNVVLVSVYAGVTTVISKDSSDNFFRIDRSLVGWWKLDNNGNDSSGNGHNGTPTNTVPNPWTAGHNNGAITLLNPSNTDYVSVADTALLRPTTALTLSAWIKIDSGSPNWTNSPGIIEHFRSPTNLKGYLLGLGGDQKLSFYIGNAGTPTWSRVQSSNTISTGAWHHVAGTWDSAVGGGEMKLYLDGVLQGIAYHGILYNTENLNIGRDKYSSVRSFNGLLDDVQIYNRALSEIEIQTLAGQ
ncbi:MAG: hypothetical protein A3C81_02075 [Candidatus Yanofskybacteria bacterium RIFCSPHIGHO2_02_FULL_46_19]|uniref:LamG-like jellyroll fold domain-containing protein n=3 Tax=Candidatus Yanofskyibacteriota TaxID=1752733 RepID=A0A1F8H3Y9_9BACT|nr:MAG: hypothetical protein A3C81_02075 [Candidatus Yanofskybacteria bacterium RIFCSPHIGHO2_02_FULL_46_19]OGN27436.1 MAG: hypothetical protein A3B17_01530 [Candidatus Yanofskybacteria bacterium RIFCSPLOWO2_01_FULL_45_72]OGN32297.1 MAG: hypothetical protein A3J01_02440 [Candidatus Yanofskybacteria bacterium RIFCSPLOWO2_02_FULL_45_18]